MFRKSFSQRFFRRVQRGGKVHHTVEKVQGTEEVMSSTWLTTERVARKCYLGGPSGLAVSPVIGGNGKGSGKKDNENRWLPLKRSWPGGFPCITIVKKGHPFTEIMATAKKEKVSIIVWVPMQIQISMKMLMALSLKMASDMQRCLCWLSAGILNGMSVNGRRGVCNMFIVGYRLSNRQTRQGLRSSGNVCVVKPRVPLRPKVWFTDGS